MLKVIQKQTYILMLVCLGFLAFAGVNGGVYADADDYTNGTSFSKETKVKTDVDQVLNVSLASNLLELYLDPSGTRANNASTYVSVSTNNSAGYYMIVSSESSDLINMSDATKTIPTISTQSGWSPYDSSSEVNRWAFRFGSGSHQPFVSGTKIASSDRAVDRDSTTIGFSAKIDYSQPAGIYKTELEFLAVANPTIMAMQDLEDAYCTETPLVVMDARDGEEYTIQMLADGKCWMLDNLRLDPTSVPLGAFKGRTDASDIALKSLKNGDGVSPYSTGSAEATSQYFTGSYTTPLVITDHKNTKVDDTPGLGSGKMGVFYNFCAASAGTYCYGGGEGNTHNSFLDICPKGWKIPSGLGNGDYKALYDALATSETEPENIQKFITVLSIPLAGRDGSQYLGEQGSLWTSTISSSSQMYITQIDSYPGLNFYEDKERDTVRPVRCVKKPELVYLQDVTPDVIASTEVGTEFTLKDKRDNEEYRVAKLADGNLWMLDNLRLDPTAVSLEVLKGNTNATDESLTYLKNGGGTEDDQYAIEPVNSDWATGDFYTTYYTPQVNISRKNEQHTGTLYGEGSGKVGVFYNYCAASAGSYCWKAYATESQASTESLCPTGWRLPRAGSSGSIEDERNDYLHLSAAYASEGSTYAPNNVLGRALNIVRVGYAMYANSNFYNENNGMFWTSTYNGARYWNHITLYSTTSSGTEYTYLNYSSENRSKGISIRCMMDLGT